MKKLFAPAAVITAILLVLMVIGIEIPVEVLALPFVATLVVAIIIILASSKAKF